MPDKSHESLDDMCLWKKSFINPKTTILDVIEITHPLYACKVCVDPKNEFIRCPNYRSERYYFDKKEQIRLNRELYSSVGEVFEDG